MFFRKKNTLKEILETGEIVKIVHDKYKDLLFDPKVIWFIPGDGTSPRTGLLLKSVGCMGSIITVDPLLKDEYVKGFTDQFCCIKGLAENHIPTIDEEKTQ